MTAFQGSDGGIMTMMNTDHLLKLRSLARTKNGVYPTQNLFLSVLACLLFWNFLPRKPVGVGSGRPSRHFTKIAKYVFVETDAQRCGLVCALFICLWLGAVT